MTCTYIVCTVISDVRRPKFPHREILPPSLALWLPALRSPFSRPLPLLWGGDSLRTHRQGSPPHLPCFRWILKLKIKHIFLATMMCKKFSSIYPYLGNFLRFKNPLKPLSEFRPFIAYPAPLPSPPSYHRAERR